MDGIYVVPKGNFVLISLSMSQVDPSIWKDGDNLIMGSVLLVKEWKVLISLLALTFFSYFFKNYIFVTMMYS